MRIEARRRGVLLAFPSGRVLLGLAPDASFADLVLPQSRVSSRAGFRAADRQNIVSAVASGYIPGYTQCPTGGGSVAANISKTAGMLSMVPNPATAIIGGIVSGFASIFGAHARAVGLEQATLCEAIPATNQFLQQIDQALNAGQISSDQAAQLVDQVVDKFQSGVAPILKMSSSACNAACVYLRMLQAIAAKRKASYSERAAATEAQQAIARVAGKPAPSAVAAGGGISPLLLAGGALAALLLFGVF